MAEKRASFIPSGSVVDEEGRGFWLELGHKGRVVERNGVDNVAGISLRHAHWKR